MPKKRVVKRKKPKPLTDPDALLAAAEDMGMTLREYVAYQNQKGRTNKTGRQKGYRGSYGKRFSGEFNYKRIWRE